MPHDIIFGMVIGFMLCVAWNEIVDWINVSRRVQCWWRGYHRESPAIGYFRFDVGGMCSDCGKNGDGINHNDD